MHGFKNSTRTQYFKGGEAKVGKVMGEFKAGTLHSGSKKGPAVENPKQAIAIALSEARKAGAKVPMKKARGGEVRQEASDKTISVQRPMSAQTTVETRRAMAVKRAKDAAPKRAPLIDPQAGDEALIPKRSSRPVDPLHGTNGYKRGGKVVEKGSGEVYASKAAMAKHEAKESKAYERKEHRKQMGGPVYAQDAQMLANDAAGLKAMSGYRKGGKVPC